MPKRKSERSRSSAPRRNLVLAGAGAALLVLVLIAVRGGGRREATPPPGEPDVILITIDTLRADALGFAGNKRVRTPTFDRLAREGLVFGSAHAHNVVTLPSHTNILTGLLPYQHGVRDNAGFVLGEEHPTLAETLKKAGYATGAFVGAFPLDSRFGLDRGFDVYDDRYREGTAPTQFVMAERPANEVVDAAGAWYQSTPGKKFLWMHLYDPHAPYRPPPPFDVQYRDAPYLGEVAWTDSEVGRFLAPILSAGRPVFLVVTADHGEGLGEHGEVTHGLFAYETTLRIPLILYEPGRITPGVERRDARHVDIVPTILERLSLTAPASLPGASLLKMDGRRDTYFEALTASFNRGWAPLVGMIHERHKYIDLPLPELYDLDKDGSELRNLIDENRRMTFRIRKLLADGAPAAASAERKISPEERTKLMSLGYLVGDAAKKEYTVEDDPKNLVHLDVKTNEVIALYEKWEIPAAIELAHEILAEREDMAIVWKMLSFLYQQSEMPERAIGTLREAIRRRIDTEAMERRLGLALSENGQAAEAVEILSRYQESEDPEVLNAFGIALADTGRLPEAIRQFERTLQIDKTNATAYQNLGIVALRAGDLQRSHGYLRSALELNDHMPIALNTLGVVYARTGNNAEAIEAWRRAVAIDPRLYDALFNLSVVAHREGRVDVAREALKKFIDTAPPQRYGRDIAAARRMLASIEGRRS